MTEYTTISETTERQFTRSIGPCGEVSDYFSLRFSVGERKLCKGLVLKLASSECPVSRLIYGFSLSVETDNDEEYDAKSSTRQESAYLYDIDSGKELLLDDEFEMLPGLDYRLFAYFRIFRDHTPKRFPSNACYMKGNLGLDLPFIVKSVSGNVAIVHQMILSK